MTKKGAIQKWVNEQQVNGWGGNNGECIIWPFRRNPAGYGRVCVNYKKTYAHRYCWETFYGIPFPYPEAKHTCHNGKGGCVSPFHLIGGTHLDNLKDTVIAGRQVKGSRQGNSILTEAQIPEICAKLAAGELFQTVADAYGVSKIAIKAIWENKTWKHVEALRSTRKKLTDDAVKEICHRLVAGELQTDIAKDFGITKTQVGRIWNGQNHAHVDAPRKYDFVRNCRGCGAQLPPSCPTHRKYCSDSCK